jgi:cytochrome c556
VTVNHDQRDISRQNLFSEYIPPLQRVAKMLQPQNPEDAATQTKTQTMTVLCFLLLAQNASTTHASISKRLQNADYFLHLT